MVFGPSTPWQLIMIQWGWWQVCQVCQCLSWKTYTCWKKQNHKSVKFLTSLSEPFNRNSVKISDCRACSLFETVPCCQIFSHSELITLKEKCFFFYPDIQPQDKWMKGVSFLRNCGATSVEEYNRVIYCNQLSWKRKLATVKSLGAEVSSVSPSSERLTKG